MTWFYRYYFLKNVQLWHLCFFSVFSVSLCVSVLCGVSWVLCVLHDLCILLPVFWGTVISEYTSCSLSFLCSLHFLCCQLHFLCRVVFSEFFVFSTFSVLSATFSCRIVLSVFSVFLHACLFFVVLCPLLLCCVLRIAALFFVFSLFPAFSELCSLRCLHFTILHSVVLNMFSGCCKAVFSMILTPELWFSVFAVMFSMLYMCVLCSEQHVELGQQHRTQQIFYPCATHMALVNTMNNSITQSSWAVHTLADIVRKQWF